MDGGALRTPVSGTGFAGSGFCVVPASGGAGGLAVLVWDWIGVEPASAGAVWANAGKATAPASMAASGRER